MHQIPIFINTQHTLRYSYGALRSSRIRVFLGVYPLSACCLVRANTTLAQLSSCSLSHSVWVLHEHSTPLTQSAIISASPVFNTFVLAASIMSTVYTIFTMLFSRLEQFLGSPPAASSVAALLPAPPAIALQALSSSKSSTSSADEGSHYTLISDGPVDVSKDAGLDSAGHLSLAYPRAMASVSDPNDTDLAVMTSATARAHLRELAAMRRELEDMRDLLARTAAVTPQALGGAATVDKEVGDFCALAASVRQI
jgi:hypothetical protein